MSMVSVADILQSPRLSLGLFCFVLCVIFFLWRGIKRLTTPAPKVFGDDLAIWPYQPLPVMTDSEVVFFRLLADAVPDELYIFSQVQLSRIIDAHESEHSGQWLNRINRMSVDYLLVDADARTTLIVIELDDWSHETTARQRADAKKDKALSCAGIPVMRYHGEHMPSVTQLHADIMQVLDEVYGV